MSMNFNTTNSTFRQLLANGLQYRVPPFQRDYSWTSIEWDELWQDIESLSRDDADPFHYMGYLVLQTTDSKKFDIIDGQQRISTISIMILAGLSILKDLIEQGIDAERNSRRLINLKDSYIGYTDPVTLIEKPKLQLNRHNDKYYRNYLVTLEKLPQRNLHASEHLIRKAFEWFKNKMRVIVKKDESGGENFASFLDQLVDKLFFTVITVNDELNAFKVFETLNARGVRLSSTDLLKNYLFSLAAVDEYHSAQIEHLEERWERIITVLGNDSFPEFLRIYWNSNHRLVRKIELFRTIRKEISSKTEAFELVRKIESFADSYTALKDSKDERWKDETKYLEQLNLYRVKQPLSMLLASYNSFFEKDRSGFLSILRAISILSFRYNVICNLPANEQEPFYNKIALKITSDTSYKPQDVILDLKNLYPSDETFKRAFSEKQFKTTDNRNKKIVKHILTNIENQYAQTSIDESSTKFNIEHILPESYEEFWPDIDHSKAENLIYRLGNMTLLEVGKNKDIANKSYEEKKDAYSTSAIKTTRQLVEHNSIWNGGSIERQQKQLSNIAASIWRINNLSN